MDEQERLEAAASAPEAIASDGFNPGATLPFGCITGHIQQAMTAFTEFLRVVTSELHSKGMVRIESLLMPANFSSVVSEFMNTSIPRYCPTLARNTYHNGHPDLVLIGKYPNNSAQYATDGIEVKASRYLSGWQGHNIEEGWLLVFVFDSNRPADLTRNVAPRPFRFVKVLGAELAREVWSFAGRSETSRRTITASVTPTGLVKMEANWIYRAPIRSGQAADAPDDEESAGDVTLS